MQDGTLAGGAVPEWAVTVRVGNTVRAAESVSIDAELPSDMPDAVGGVSGVSARTGTIVWAPQEAVLERPSSPWTRASSWPPAPGTSVGVWVGDSATSWKVFTGVIDKTTGDPGSLVSKIIDASDRLNRRATFYPVAHRMPGHLASEDGQSLPSITTHVQPWHAMYRCLRVAGFSVTAPGDGGGLRLVASDFQGSIWPTAGSLRSAPGDSPTALSWGEGWTYLSAGSVAYTPRDHSLTSMQGVRTWVRFAAMPGAIAGTVLLGHSSARTVRYRVNVNAPHTSMTVTGELWEGDPAGGGTLIASGSTTLTPVVEDGTIWADMWTPFWGHDAFRVSRATTEATGSTPNSETSVPVTIGATLPARGEITHVSVGGPTVGLRATMITYEDWAAMSSQSRNDKVQVWGQGLVRSQHTSRTVEGRVAQSVLEEIGQATLTSMWIDETGVMQVAPSNLLYAQSPVRKVTTAQDIFALGWVESLLSTRHNITVTYLRGALNLSRRYGITLYQPSNGATLENGNTNEDFIDVPPEEEWFDVDTTLMRIGTEDTNIAFSAGHRSFYGGIYDDASGIQRWALATSEFDYTMTTLGLRTWLLEQTNTRSDGHDLQLISKDEDAEASLKKRWRNQPLPIIRGRGRTAFTDASYTASQTGPSTAPDLEHDLGTWGQAADAKRVADWLASRLTTPLITLTDLEIGYDPRLQLGDVITVDSFAFYGFSVDCLIIGKSEQHGSGSHMTLTVRVIRVRSTAITYAEFEAAYSGRNYAALESAWAGATYSQLESNALGGA